MKRSKSFVESRHRKLLSALDEQPSLTIPGLAETLGVSPVTIRRDLDALESKHLLVRTRGGARLTLQPSPALPQLSDRRRQQLAEKERISCYVASLVKDRSTIFLNAGSTTYLTIRQLLDRPVRLITNNVQAIALFANARAELLMTGGEYNPHNGSFLGDMALQLLSHLHADICILGVNGISSKCGITSYAYQETLLNQTMLSRCSGKRIIVADGTKIGKVFCFTSAPLDSIDMLVTDSSADPQELERIADAGVEVVTVDD